MSRRLEEYRSAPRKPETAASPWQRTLYILVVAQLMTAAGFSNVVPFLSLYVQELGTNTGLSVEFLAGMAYSAQAMTMMAAAPIWGSLADRFGRKMMVQRALVSGAVIVFLMGFARSAEELVLLRAVQGLLTGSLSAANALVAAETPRERTGFAMSTLQVGHWAGLAAGPLLGGVVADALGYRQAFFITALLIGLAAVLVRVGVVENFVPIATVIQTRTGLFADWRAIFRAPGAPATYWMRFSSNLGRMMVVPILPLFMVSLLGNEARVNTMTGLAFGLSSAASTVTAVYLGRLGDRIGHRRILQVSAVSAGLLHLSQGWVANAGQLLAVQILAGAAAGGIIPTLSALLATYSRPGKEGSIYGLDNSVNAASRAVAPLLGAAAAQLIGARPALALSGLAFLLVGYVAFWRLPPAGEPEEQQT